MSDKWQVQHGEDVVFVGLSVPAWFLGPVRWVVQANPGLTEVDWNTHVLAYKGYGFYFFLAVGVFSILYLSSPYLWAMSLNLYRRARQRCMVWNDSTIAR